MRMPVLIALVLLVTACGLETEPDPNYQSSSGGSGGNGGSSGGGAGGSDAGDAGGEGGTGGTGQGGMSGGQGGTTGGQGGDSAVTDCDDDDECSAMLPQCNAVGQCVSCTSNAACSERDPLSHCDTKAGSDKRGQCVACLQDDHCEGNDDGDYCLDGACVPCKADADCTDISKPQCGTDGQCTGCTSDGACDGRTGTEACLTTPGPNRGRCVACVADDDCSSADAPQCKSNNTCGTCTSDAACAGREGAERCNRRVDAETFGECVECTGATEDDDCDGKSCKQSTGECTDVTIGDLSHCEPCEADSQCDTGTKCVRHVFEGSDLGYFCFYQRTMCADVDSAIKPYSQALPDTLSIDSTEASQQATFCLPITSCLAIANATAGTDCGTDSTVCGVTAVDDGICLTSSSAMGKCSYGCASDNDCLNGVGENVLDSCVGPPAAKTCQP